MDIGSFAGAADKYRIKQDSHLNQKVLDTEANLCYIALDIGRGPGQSFDLDIHTC